MERWERYSLASLTRGEQDPFGKLLISSLGQREMHNLRMLNAGVDTVRQLYQGKPQLPQFDKIITVYQEGKGATMRLFEQEWSVGAGAAGSGFRYRLQNNELGVIVFFQARHVKTENIGTHLKIELSPHFIQERSPQQCQKFMDMIAASMLTQVEPVGTATKCTSGKASGKTPSMTTSTASTTLRKPSGGSNYGSTSPSSGNTRKASPATSTPAKCSITPTALAASSTWYRTSPAYGVLPCNPTAWTPAATSSTPRGRSSKTTPVFTAQVVHFSLT